MKQTVNNGDSGSSARTKINDNFTELYNTNGGYKRSGDNNVYLTNAINALAASTGALGTNGLRAFPIFIPREMTITDVISEVTSFAGSSTYRIGLYTDSNGYPDALIANSDTGTFDSGSVNGVKTGTFSSAIVLQRGLHWIAINSNGTPTMRCIAAGGSMLIGTAPALGTAGFRTLWSATLAYQAMPANFPAGASPSGAVLVTLFGFKVSA